MASAGRPPLCGLGPSSLCSTARVVGPSPTNSSTLPLGPRRNRPTRVGIAARISKGGAPGAFGSPHVHVGIGIQDRKSCGMTKPRPRTSTRFVDAKPGGVLVIDVETPSEPQLEAATDRVASLIADLWARGLLAGSDED